MDAEGGRMIHRDTRSRRLAVVVVVQNVLVAACLVVTAYVYWTQGHVKDVHIQLEAKTDVNHNGSLEMMHVHSNFMMGLLNNKTIYTNCTGSYLLYLGVCYTSMDKNRSSGLLQLQDSTFTLQASHETCRGLHGITYLTAGQEVSLQLFITANGFKIKNMTVELNYLSRESCES